MPPLVDEKAKLAYREHLQRCRKEKSSEPIPNRFPWHGDLAIRELLTLATDEQEGGRPLEVRILTGSAPDRVYGSDDPGIWHNYINAGGRINILLWGDNPAKCRGVLRSLYNAGQPIELKFSGTNQLAGRINHFIVVGDRAYRLEAPHEPFPDDVIFSDCSPEMPARICFNDTVGGAQLVKFFDALWNFGHSVSSPRKADETAPAR